MKTDSYKLLAEQIGNFLERYDQNPVSHPPADPTIIFRKQSQSPHRDNVEIFRIAKANYTVRLGDLSEFSLNLSTMHPTNGIRIEVHFINCNFVNLHTPKVSKIYLDTEKIESDIYIQPYTGTLYIASDKTNFNKTVNIINRMRSNRQDIENKQIPLYLNISGFYSSIFIKGNYDAINLSVTTHELKCDSLKTKSLKFSQYCEISEYVIENSSVKHLENKCLAKHLITVRDSEIQSFLIYISPIKLIFTNSRFDFFSVLTGSVFADRTLEIFNTVTSEKKECGILYLPNLNNSVVQLDGTNFREIHFDATYTDCHISFKHVVISTLDCRSLDFSSIGILEISDVDFKSRPKFPTIHDKWPNHDTLGYSDSPIWLNTYSELRIASEISGQYDQQLFFARCEYQIRQNESTDWATKWPLKVFGSISGYGLYWHRCMLLWWLCFFLFWDLHILIDLIRSTDTKNAVFNSLMMGSMPIFFRIDLAYGHIHVIAMLTHGLVSSILLFLIGLGLRTRLRLK